MYLKYPPSNESNDAQIGLSSKQEFFYLMRCWTLGAVLQYCIEGQKDYL